MFCKVSVHSPGVCRCASTISASWQPLHTWTSCGFPAPSGNRSWTAPARLSVHAVARTPHAAMTRRFMNRLLSSLDAEGIQRAVVGFQVDSSVGDGNAREMIPLMHLVPARPELLAGARVERVDHGARPLRGANR